MTLPQACTNYIGPSNFRDGVVGGAVWFHQDADTGALSRFSWQGLRVVRAIQQRLNVTTDGAWGARTNAALRPAMRRLGMDPSIVQDGQITPAMMQAALAVAYTIGSEGAVPATSPAAVVCLPRTAVMPVWNQKPLGPDASPDAVEVLLNDDGSPSAAPTPWRVPNGATILSRVASPGGENLDVLYRTIDGRVRHAVVSRAGGVVSDGEASSADLDALGLSTAPPGTPAPTSPGDPPEPTVAPDRGSAYGDGNPPPPPPANRGRTALLIGSAVVGVLALGFVASVLAREPQKAMAPPPAAPAPAPSRQNPRRRAA